MCVENVKDLQDKKSVLAKDVEGMEECYVNTVEGLKDINKIKDEEKHNTILKISKRK